MATINQAMVMYWAVPAVPAAFPQTASLVSYYKLNGNSNDNKGSNNGTDTSVTYSAGKIGDAWDYNGSAYSSMWNVMNFDGTTAFSISAWVKLNSTTANQMIVGKQLNSWSFGGYIIWYQYSGWYTARINFSLVSNDSTFGSIEIVNPNNVVVTWTYYHIVGTYDGSRTAAWTKLYINAVDVWSTGTDTFAGKTSNTSAPFNIGSRNSWNLPTNGQIDETGIWDGVALTAGEVTTLYNGGLGLTYT